MSAQHLQCPICSGTLPAGSTNADLNRHVDECLNMSFIEKEEDQPPEPQHFFPPPPPQSQQPQPQPPQPQPFPPPPKDGEIRCEVCGKGFQTFSQYFSHKGQEHPAIPGFPQDIPKEAFDLDFECPCCGERFASYDEFSTHISTSPCRNTLHKSAEDDGLPDLPVLLPQELTGDYHSFDLQTPMPGECGICYEDFELGQMVARLDCLCLYHKGCVKAWYDRGQKRCPLHGEDYSKVKW